MPWFQVDDQLGFHPKAVAAGNAAMGLWVRAGSWCSLHLTEGFVPSNIARSMGTPAQVRRLVEVGLWVAVDGGYDFHQWDARQMSKEEIEERRRKRADAGRKGGQKSGITRRAGSKQGSKIEASASALAQAKPEQELQQNRTPVLVPVLSGYLGGEALEPNAHEKSPPPRSCPDHLDGSPPDCGRCQELIRAYTAWTADQVAQEFALAGRCRAHQDVENPPDCGRCADARRDRDRRQAEHVRRLAAAQSGETQAAASARAAAIAACDMCRETGGYRDNRLCSLDPEDDERNRRGAAVARIAICKLCDTDGRRADGTDCDHKPTRKTPPTEGPPDAA